MEEFISQLVKLITNTVIVHIYSYPHFAIETFLSAVLCVSHLLLIFEVNNLYRRTNVRAAARLRQRHPQLKDVESCSYHTISRLQTQIFPQRIETTATKHAYFAPSYRKLNNNKKVSTHSNFGWVISRGDSKYLRNPYTDRVEHLLSVSPSEYVRKDKERKNREAGLRSCIHSLTSLLEKALNNDAGVMENVSRDAIKKSINAIKENFEYQIATDFPMMDYGNPSLHSLIGQSLNKKYIKSNLSPPRYNEFTVSKQDFEKGDECDRERDSNIKTCKKNSSGDLSDIFDDKSIEVLHAEQNIPLRNQ